MPQSIACSITICTPPTALRSNCIRALTATQRDGDQLGLAQTHRGLGRAYLWLLRFDEAIVHFGQALTLFESLEDQAGQTYGHLDLGRTYGRRGDYA